MEGGSRSAAPPEIVVFWGRRESVCDGCGAELGAGTFIRLIDGEARCLDCADLGHLVFLPRGDATLTRRASKHSGLRAVVRWSPARKRYERQGVLVEDDALHRAEEECERGAGSRAEARARAAVQRERLDRRFVEEFARAIERGTRVARRTKGAGSRSTPAGSTAVA